MIQSDPYVGSRDSNVVSLLLFCITHLVSRREGLKFIHNHLAKLFFGTRSGSVPSCDIGGFDVVGLAARPAVHFTLVGLFHPITCFLGRSLPFTFRCPFLIVALLWSFIFTFALVVLFLLLYLVCFASCVDDRVHIHGFPRPFAFLLAGSLLGTYVYEKPPLYSLKRSLT